MTFKNMRSRIQRVDGLTVIIRLMIGLAIVFGGVLWASAMVIQYMKGI